MKEIVKVTLILVLAVFMVAGCKKDEETSIDDPFGFSETPLAGEPPSISDPSALHRQSPSPFAFPHV